MKLSTIVIAVFIFFPLVFSAQEKNYKALCVAFYNLENLYDTIDDPLTDDSEFLPKGKKNWNTDKYKKKISNLARVISGIGEEINAGGPVIIGLCEVENRAVLEDLISEPRLARLNYGIVHYDGPDKRGVDVALLYMKDYFEVISSLPATLKITGDDNFRTRDQLIVTGKLQGEVMHLIVNHWPSRRGGEKRSLPFRLAAAELCRASVDSILLTDSLSKIIVMGDMNDDPTDESIVLKLKAKGEKNSLLHGELYNPMNGLFKKGLAGSLAYRDKWNLFDQIIISRNLLTDSTGYFYHKAGVCNKNFMVQQSGNYKGYPYRTYVGNNFKGGYSDHFPVYIILINK